MSTEIILRNDGTAFRRETREHDLGDISDTLVRFVEHTPFCIPFITQNWHMIRRPTERLTIMFREVPVLRMHASFAVRTATDRLLVSPDYTMNPDNSRPNRIEGMFEWRPHPSLQIIIAVQHSSPEEFDTFLFFRHRTTHRIYRPPMGNIYDDSKICLGNFDRQRNGTIETSQQILNWIMASRWNSDITNYTTPNVQALFSWDADRVQIPVPENWPEHCASFSHDCPNIISDTLITGVL